jgi:hypothetical protein
VEIATLAGKLFVRASNSNCGPARSRLLGCTQVQLLDMVLSSRSQCREKASKR